MPMAQRLSNREGPAARAEGYGGPQDPAGEAARESDHRIANNLQLLMAMIAAEKREAADPALRLALTEVLDRMMGRIGAIAGVHRQLTRPAGSGMVDAGGYLRALALQIETACRGSLGRRGLVVSAEPVPVPARLAAAMGLIVSECVLNACKYAYSAKAPGEVRIDLRLAGPRALRLCVEDDGIGRAARDSAPGGTAPDPGFGTRLIETLAARIGAAPLWEEARPGTRFVLAVPLHDFASPA